MKKLLVTFSLIALAFTAFAQKNQYAVEIIKPDSIFIWEKTFKKVDQSPLPQETKTATFYKSEKEISDLIKRLRDQAESMVYIAEQIENELQKSKATVKK